MKRTATAAAGATEGGSAVGQDDPPVRGDPFDASLPRADVRDRCCVFQPIGQRDRDASYCAVVKCFIVQFALQTGIFQQLCRAPVGDRRVMLVQ